MLTATQIEAERRRQVVEADWGRAVAAGWSICAFCGTTWFPNRHDPLKMAGVATIAGSMRHFRRAVAAAFERLLRALGRGRR